MNLINFNRTCRRAANNLTKKRRRKAFSLVELVVVILIIAILAVSVFAGGSAAIKKSQVSRATSDLHNFAIAIETSMNETPSVANIVKDTYSSVRADGGMMEIVDAVNRNLTADYQLDAANPVQDINGKNLNVLNNNTSLILQSSKTDAWDNPYYVIFDFGERHCTGQSDFYITVVSAGPNAQTTVGGKIEADDIFLLVQYSDGDVSAMTYSVDTDKMYVAANVDDTTGSYDLTAKDKTNTSVKGSAGELLYSGGENYNGYTGADLPINF